MTSTHSHGAPEHGTHHEHDGHDWNDEAFVATWLEDAPTRAPERLRESALVRALIPKRPEAEFRYLNIGAGPGDLDELLLDHFPNATATLVDVSLMMLAAARGRLERFGDRVEYVRADLAGPDWTGAVGSGVDLAISTNALHHLQADRIRTLYGDLYNLLGHGGVILNLDYVRTEDPSLMALAGWAAQDPDAGLTAGDGPDVAMLSPLSAHLEWLRAAGFRSVDILWRDIGRSLLFGVRDHFHLPEAGHGHS